MEAAMAHRIAKSQENEFELDLTQRTQTAPDLMSTWAEYQKLRHDKPDLFGLKSTGLASLDFILQGGVEFGQYVLIGGAQKGGKTTLLKHIANSYGEQDVNSIILSAEMTNIQVATMFISSETQIERSKVRGLGLTDDDWLKINEASEKIGMLSLTFHYGFSTVEDIYQTIDAVEYITERPVRAIFGDYIHLMESKIGRTRQEQIASISRRLKLMSITRPQPMAIFMAAQLNRESVRGTVIEMTSFLGSGQLERDMDIGMIIHDVKDENGDAIVNEKQISVVGSRETGIGECRVSYNGATASLYNHIKIIEGQKDDYWMP